MKTSTVKTTILLVIPFIFIGTFPRLIGVLNVRPGYEWVYVLDVVMVVILIVAAGILCLGGVVE